MKKLPKIAIGAWAWGNDGTFGNTYSSANLKNVYEMAISNGLNLFDTATVYGMGTSEKILGELIKDTNKEDLIISTKFTPQIEDGTKDAMKNMLKNSMKYMGVDYIDIYWIHNPMDVEKYTPMLIPLFKEGLIKSIGVSNHNLDELKRAEEILAKEGLHISYLQNHYSLLYRSSEDAGLLDYCKDNNITFFAYMVLEQGALSGKYNTKNMMPEGSYRASIYNPVMERLEKLTDTLSNVGKKYNASSARIAVAWAISKGVLPIIGVTKEEQVLEAVKTSKINLTEEDIILIEKAAKEANIDTKGSWEHPMN